MQSYRPYTHDVEGTTLSEDEWVEFAHIIQELCHLHVQHQVSQLLGGVEHKWGMAACDNLQRRARESWKTAIASRVKSEDTEEDVLA
jgi:hypothetical protein